MRKLVVFNQVSLDGYIADAKGDMSWAHKAPEDVEWNAFVAGNASGEAELLFGRITYELMASYWPTPMAAANDPVVAEGMNRLPKVVFSRTLDQVSWKNTRLVKGNPAAEVRKLKQETGPDMVILGSGSIIAQLTREGLIDEFQVIVNPIVLGGGKTMFQGIKEKVALRLTQSRVFGNGNVMLRYEPGPSASR